MSNFCGFCGTAATGTPYCAQCGQPVLSPTPDRDPESTAVATPRPAPVQARTAQPPQRPPLQGPLPPPHHGPNHGPHQPPYRPSHPQPPQAPPQMPQQTPQNPFAVTPVSDYVRDLGSVVCLLSVLGMPWDFSGDAADRWWVVIGVVIALFALPLPYVGGSRLVPGLSAQHVRLAKAALTMPLWAGVGAALVNELINVGEDFAGGVGSGVAMAVAAALLTAQPRSNDESEDPRGAWGWVQAARVTAVLAAVAPPLGFVAFFLEDVTGDQLVVTDALALAYIAVVAVVTISIAVSWPAFASLGAGAAWKRVLGTVGFAALGAALVSQGGSWSLDGDVVKWSHPVSGGFLLAAAAALAVSRPVHQPSDGRRHPALDWVTTAAAATAVTSLLAGAGAVGLVLYSLQVEEVQATVVVLVVLLVVSAVLLTVASAMVSATPRRRVTVLCLLSVELLLTVVIVSVAAAQDVFFPSTAVLAGALFALPSLAVLALTTPPSVRRSFGPVVVAPAVPTASAYR